MDKMRTSAAVPDQLAPLTPVTGSAAWYGRDMAQTDEWIYRFGDADIAEIDAAVGRVRTSKIPLPAVTRADFELPTLAPKLERIQHDVVNGRGFVLLRGLPVQRFSIEESAIAYWGLGAHIGEAVSQNAKGHLLGHVKDIGHDPANPTHRIYATSARHLYHTDSCDIVGLLCLHQAKRGGQSSMASSVTIHNEMLAVRPDLVEVLTHPLPVDRKGEVPKGKQPFYEMPVFHYFGGYLTTIYARDFIESAQRFDRVRLTDIQIEAMDLLDALAAREDIRLEMMLEPGDIQFLHNHQILHARTAYEDHPEAERRRHLLRLWLSAPNGRPLPPVFAERYGNVEVGARRGGIMVPGAALQVPLEAE